MAARRFSMGSSLARAMDSRALIEDGRAWAARRSAASWARDMRIVSRWAMAGWVYQSMRSSAVSPNSRARAARSKAESRK